MESELRDESLATMEAEQRTVLLDQMLRLGLSLKDVKGILEKQVVSRRSSKEDTDQVLMEKKSNIVEIGKIDQEEEEQCQGGVGVSYWQQ